jgi:aromatic ring-opening dioxygenase catalytic subunit (LigB family)
MGSIVGAALVSHVPTLVLPEAERRALNGGEDTTLVEGLDRLRRERLDAVAPDTIVVFDGHWATTVETVVAAHARRAGRYTSEELPRGMSAVPYDITGDPELACAYAAAADGRDDTWVTAIDDPHLPIHYPTVNLLPFLQRDERWVSVSIVQTGEVDDFLLAGRLLAEAIANVDRRVVVLASAGLSHRFWPLRQFRQHEGADPALHLRSPEARAADEQVLAWMRAGDHRSIIGFMPEFRAFAPEARFGHYLLMAGAMGGVEWSAPGTQYGDYEAVAGTGQAHVWFDAPPG